MILMIFNFFIFDNLKCMRYGSQHMSRQSIKVEINTELWLKCILKNLECGKYFMLNFIFNNHCVKILYHFISLICIFVLSLIYII